MCYYKTEGVVFGDEICEHDFSSQEVIKKTGGFSGEYNENRKFLSSSSCLKCNAWKGELGLEPDFGDYVKHLVSIFREVKRVLRDDGTLWVVIGDTYYTESGSDFKGSTERLSPRDGLGIELANKLRGKGLLPSKSLCGIPFRFAIAMIENGWILRNSIIWEKDCVMPSSSKDRFTNNFEYVFFFTKRKDYFFEQQTELTKSLEWRNKRAVWHINPKPVDYGLYGVEHFASYPEKLVRLMISAGCPKGGVVLDPFVGSGTTVLVALKMGREGIGFELNKDYVNLANNRIKGWMTQTRLG